MSNLNEQLRVTLGIVRERIEICRAVERDIEALLVSDGAVYPVAAKPAAPPVTPTATTREAGTPWKRDAAANAAKV